MNRGKETVFPYFEIEKTLKSGKRGNVHLVRYRDTKIRCIYREFAGNEEVYHKLQEIDCPHLPKIYGIQEQDGQVYVLEEYIQGDTLAFLLEGSPLTQAQTEEISMQICEALKILHGLGAVHRDIKPENIIIRGNEAVLIDFDVSRLVKPENHTDTQIMGTTGYAAPEQYGFSQTDARADIYAMGILINEMLTGQHPSKRLEAGPLRPIIERCIEVNVDKRYPTAEELRRAIGAFRKAGKKKKKITWPGNDCAAYEPACPVWRRMAVRQIPAGASAGSGRRRASCADRDANAGSGSAAPGGGNFRGAVEWYKECLHDSLPL